MIQQTKVDVSNDLYNATKILKEKIIDTENTNYINCCQSVFQGSDTHIRFGSGCFIRVEMYLY
jgi:hypothetical protein